MPTPEFTRFKGLIRKGYVNSELLKLLDGAKPGQTISKAKLKKSGVDIGDFQGLDPYFAKNNGGIAFTDYGKKIFEGQLIADGKDKPKPRKRVREHKSYGEIENDMLGL